MSRFRAAGVHITRKLAGLQMGTDGGMSLRTDELDESEALRDLIRERAAAAGE